MTTPPRNSSAVMEISTPAFVLNAPFSLDTRVANNATMKKLGDRRNVDRSRAFAQWESVYHHLAGCALVYLLPSSADLQDQAFVANLGITLPHARKPVAVISRFRAPGRAGESRVGAEFLRGMGFHASLSPDYFEGEADLKYLREAIYFGGHGLRSSRKAHRWLEKKHGLEIVPVPLFDPHLYHLDCVLHVISRTQVLLATAACPVETVRAVERVAEIIDVPLPLAYRGATNVARAGSMILCDSCLPELKTRDPLHAVEKSKRRFWEKLARRLQLDPVFFNLSEFYKSGAMLSCLVLPLNYPHLQ